MKTARVQVLDRANLGIPVVGLLRNFLARGGLLFEEVLVVFLYDLKVKLVDRIE